MPKPHQCSHCQKPATIHLTQIVDNKILKADLCDDCPLAKSMSDPGTFSLGDLVLNAMPPPREPSEALRCEQCGFTPADFKKHGRFGCPQCYTTFSSMIEPMLDNLHHGTRHLGKVPQEGP